MRRIDFYEQIQSIGEPTVIDLLPGPLQFRVNWQDAMAARLLLWLEEQILDMTDGDLTDVLSAAQWWHTFWTSLHFKPDKATEEEVG